LTNDLKIDLSNWNHLLIKGSRSMQLERIITFIETL
jgi:UDP-N-acetylmuramyl pentapeptide synthase